MSDPEVSIRISHDSFASAQSHRTTSSTDTDDLDPPSPDDDPPQVQAFVRRYFTKIRPDLGEEDIRKKVMKAQVSGDVLYEQPQEVMKDRFGDGGVELYDYLNNSKYGYTGGYWFHIKVAVYILPCIFIGTRAFCGAYKKESGTRWPEWGLAFAIATTVGLYYLSTWSLFKDASWWPTKLKVRNRDYRKFTS